MNGPVILDASPIILLSRASRLDLLICFGRELVVPQPVADEVRAKGPKDRSSRALDRSEHFRILPVDAVDDAVRPWNLGRGESAVLSLARQIPGLAILDDLQARRCAEWLGISLSGTVGVVLKAKMVGHIELARPVLTQLVSAGMHLSSQTMNAILARVGE